MKRWLISGGVATFLLGAAALGLSQAPADREEPVPAVPTVPPAPEALPAEPPKFLDDLKPVIRLDGAVKQAVAPESGWATTRVDGAKEDLTSALIAILNKTESFDTFFVTVNLLEDLGAAAKPAIPAIVRNAERLGVFKNHFPAKGRDGEMVEEIYKKLKTIREAQPEEPQKDTIRPAAYTVPAGGTTGTAIGGIMGAVAGNVEGKAKQETPVCMLRPREGKNEVKVVICDLVTRLPKDHDADVLRGGDLRYHLRRQLLDCLGGSGKLKVASAREMEKAVLALEKKDAPTARQIGEKLEADYVILVTFRSSPLRKTEHGPVTAPLAFTLSVFDMRTPDEDAVHVEEMSIRDERVEEVTEEQMRFVVQEMMMKAAREIVKRFGVDRVTRG